MDNIRYIVVNFNPSRYALDFVFLPSINVDKKIDIIGISILIVFVVKE